VGEDVENLKQRLPLLDYLRQQSWTARPIAFGPEFVGLCPLHPETRPSFYVNARKNLFYCHGCGQGGDLIRFVQLSRHLSFRQSVAYLEQQSTVPTDSLAVLEQAAIFYQQQLEENHSSRSAKGNKYLRRLLSQVAHAAVKKNGSHFEAVFRRLLPRLGYQSAIWAIAHRLCRVLWKILQEGVRFIEQGKEPDPQAKKQRAGILARAHRKLGYNVAISPMNPPTAESATPTQ